jgi:RHS repeat-associated protein
LTAVTAPSGRQIIFAYNSQGLVASAADPSGLTINYGYDASDDLTSVSDSSDPSTPRWQLGYDDSHELTSIADGDANTTQITYQAGQVVQQTDPRGETRTWSYTSGATMVTSPNGNVTRYLFDSQNEPTSITRGYGTSEQSTQTLQYNSGGEPTSITDGDGNTTSYTYDAAGDRTNQTDPKGRSTVWTHDGQHDVTSVTVPSGEETTYGYNSQGLPTTVSINGSGQPAETTSSTYNGQGELTSETDARGKTTSYGYDPFGDLASVTDAAGDETTYGYDADGRVTSTVAPAGNAPGGVPAQHTTSYSYNALGDLTSSTDPLGKTTSYTYDPAQNLTSVTDPDGHTTSYTYDADNERATTTQADGSTDTNAYDSDGNLVAQANGDGDTTTYTYDPLDRLASVTNPANRTTSYGYDADGNLTSVTDPVGRTTTNGYDDADELTSISYSEGQTPNVTYAYDADGERTSMSDGTGTTTYSYDSLDRLTSETNGADQTVSYGYDTDNDTTSIGYPNGKTVMQTFDADDRLASVSDWLGNKTSFGYDPDSNLQTTTYPSATADLDTYGYSDDDELTSVQMTQSSGSSGSTTLADIGYTLDPDGLVSNETQTGLPGAASTSYTYTPLNQVATAGSSDYSYDNAANVTELDGNSGYQYNQASELTSSPTSSYAYDQLGERASTTPSGGSATTYSYDQAGRLTTLTPPAGTATSYSYDGNGLLAAETTAGTTSHYAWNQTTGLPLALTDGENNYIYGPNDLPIEQIDANGHPTYLHHDQLGSTRLITNQTGNTTATFTYNPYGKLAASTGTATTPLGYAGQYTDPNTGLIYMRARWYDPATGQFMSMDPLEAVTQQPYSYAGDDPINGTDPTGLDDAVLGLEGASRNAAACQQDPNSPACAGTGALNAIGSGASWVAGKVWQHRGAVAEAGAAIGCLSGAFDVVGVAACPAATLGGLAVSVDQTVTDSCLSTGQKIGGTLLDGLATVPGLQDTFLDGGAPLKWLAGIVGGAGIASEGPIVANSP